MGTKTLLPDDALIYTTKDKTTWGAGPWQDEPDKVQWLDHKTDLDCLIKRNYSGAWCGYVGVAEGHPLFGKSYGDVEVQAHGGLTYADFCEGEAEPCNGICHVPYPGRPEHVWWFGFDCNHAWDFAPGVAARLETLMPGRAERWKALGMNEHYWTMPEVIREVRKLAREVRKVG